jgi:hypothetical protein
LLLKDEAKYQKQVKGKKEERHSKPWRGTKHSLAKNEATKRTILFCLFIYLFATSINHFQTHPKIAVPSSQL